MEFIDVFLFISTHIMPIKQTLGEVKTKTRI